MKKDSISVFRPDQFESHTTGIEESDNYYYPALELSSLVSKNSDLVARSVRIEAKDTESPKHQHPGASLGFVLSGSGILRGEDQEHKITQGDVFYIPAYVTHVFQADVGTNMTQHIVYIGSSNELQDYIPVD